MRYLHGNHAPFRTAAERRNLIGKRIQYLQGSDIDRSGRGYLSPRRGLVVAVSGRNIFLADDSSIYAGDLVEVVILPEAEGQP